MSLSQLPVFAQKGNKLTFEQLVHSIKTLTHELDVEKFHKIASDLQAVICDGLKSDSNTQDLLLDIMEGLNNLRVGSHKNRANDMLLINIIDVRTSNSVQECEG